MASEKIAFAVGKTQVDDTTDITRDRRMGHLVLARLGLAVRSRHFAVKR